jgi:acetyl-CoA C-acetyltransferase
MQTCEDLGLCRYGESGKFVESGAPFMPNIDYGLAFKPGHWKKVPVNPSGGLLACGHPVGATGLMQAVFAFWQLQGTVGKHLKDDALQIKDAKRGLIHSHAGTGTYITVTILEKA